MHRVELVRAAIRQLASLDRDLQQRLGQKIQALSADPRPPGCKKLKGHADLYRIRVGAYRAVYEVDDTPFEEGEIAYSGLVTVTIIAHRREVYD